MARLKIKIIFLSLALAAAALSVGGMVRPVLAQNFGINEVNGGLNNSLSATDPRELAGRVINIALGFLGVIAVGLIIYAGFLWMTSNGDEEKVGQAKNLLKNAAIGLVIILAAWGIAVFILNKLGGSGGTGGGGCYDGQIAACGCGGSMICSNGSYGGCVGSDCSGGGIKPTSCDGNTTLPGCQAVDQICSSSDYCDHASCACQPKGGLGAPCNADATGATCQADNNRCGQYLTCSPTTCTCYGPPVITGISPLGGFCNDNPNKPCAQDSDCPSSTCNLTAPNGAPGNFLTITGQNFETYSATSSRVIFAGNVSGQDPSTVNSACVNFWTDNQIVIAVPTGAQTGPIKVVNKDGLSDNSNDSVGPTIPDFQSNNISRPGLCNLTPVSGTLSSVVSYAGLNLYSGSAYFGNYQTNVQALRSNFTNPTGLLGSSTIPNIKPGTSGSFVQRQISGVAENSNFLSFTKNAEPNSGPFISSFTPASGTTGQYVTIRGSGFGGARDTNHVYFGSTEASYDFPAVCLQSIWKDNQIIVKVPAGLSDGDYTIKIRLASSTIDTQNLNPNTFSFAKNQPLAPSLCKIDPSNGPTATPVSLWGEYFGRLGDSGLVKFNYEENATGTIVADGSADKISTAVPLGAITGPVHVVASSRAGNDLNFQVGECASNADCGTQVCCPASTYKQGQCVDSLADCLTNIPTSVFEWSFNTGFSTSTPNPYGYSCAGLAQYYGTCQTGASCPNVPGTCSPYAGGPQAVGNCDHTCATVPGCGGPVPNNCTYDATADVCVKNGSGAVCSLAKNLSYTLNGQTLSAPETCNADGHWEANITTACPTGWTKTGGNKCVDATSSCSLCSSNFTCQSSPSDPTSGRCVSSPICPAGATCQTSTVPGGQDQCIATAGPTCACCCPISPDPVVQAKNDQQYCCAYTNPITGTTGQLTCQGRCGSDVGKTTPATLGKCGGCAAAGDTAAERDAACNCTGHTGQYCDTTNPLFPQGVCTDCSDLNSADCSDHSAACCLDAKKTNSSGQSICRGGSAITAATASNPSDVGYCAYYNCQASPNNTLCATSTPVKIGVYPEQSTCIGGCQQTNQCSNFTTLASCEAASGCCFDAQATNGPKCRSGNQIPALNPDGTTNADQGYCAYYNCQAAPNNTLCATSTPVKDGPILNNSVDACVANCAVPPAGPGLSCTSQSSLSCDSSLCNYPAFSCLTDSGTLGGLTPPDCGTCCCQPGTTDPLHPGWKCLADKGNCTGASRGLFCGCQSDNECGSPSTVGCGSDTCCQSRPQIASSSPANLAGDVCRNALLRVDFNTNMDMASFAANVLLLEEHDYGNGVCPTGTYLTKSPAEEDFLAAQNKNWFARLRQTLVAFWDRLTGRLSAAALAMPPSSNKLYCAIPGTVYGENDGNYSSLFFAPQRLLDPNASYYLVIKGDESLNSQTGVLSAKEIGFNGLGYVGPTGTSTPLQFNTHQYPHAQAIQFTTLSDQGPNAGVCSVDHVQVNPTSYLFKTTDNALPSVEDDTNASSTTFDTAADRDKVFTAAAYSAAGQILQPVSGYSWNWSFQSDNPGVVATSTVPNLPADRIFVTAQKGVTDSQAKLTATIHMTSGNAAFGGDGFNNFSNLYVFICQNPWPPVSASGLWSPWTDTCVGSVNGNCSNYNYKFYYCRDAGTTGTQDDLPAIDNQAVIRGGSLACSTDGTPCPASAQAGVTTCGSSHTGLCVWNILKESYFFREPIPNGAQLNQAINQKTGGAVQLVWQSNASAAAAYKVYYLPADRGTLFSQSFPVAGTCTTAGNINTCRGTISGLTNNVAYIFQVSVISPNQTESALSAGLTATPTDETPPAVPVGLNAQLVGNSSLKFTWTANTDDTAFYRLYHGLASRQYGESFDSGRGATILSLPLSQFSAGTHYFALTALDAYKNESNKSPELLCSLTFDASTSAPTWSCHY